MASCCQIQIEKDLIDLSELSKNKELKKKCNKTDLLNNEPIWTLDSETALCISNNHDVKN